MIEIIYLYIKSILAIDSVDDLLIGKSSVYSNHKKGFDEQPHHCIYLLAACYRSMADLMNHFQLLIILGGVISKLICCKHSIFHVTSDLRKLQIKLNSIEDLLIFLFISFRVRMLYNSSK